MENDIIVFDLGDNRVRIKRVESILRCGDVDQYWVLGDNGGADSKVLGYVPHGAVQALVLGHKAKRGASSFVRRLLRVLILAAVLASSCAGSSPANSPNSPIDAFVGGAGFGLDPSIDTGNIAATAVQESIQRCMAERGFDYRPLTPAVSVFNEQYGDDSRQWIETYGFGISTLYFTNSQVGGLTGIPDTQFANPLAEEGNAEQFASLSPEGQSQYLFALFGDIDSPHLEDGDPTADRGCQGIALSLSRAGDGLTRFREQFETELADLEEAVLADQRALAYFDALEECFSADGYEYRLPDQLRAELEPELEQIRAASSSALRLDPDQLDKLATIQQSEIDLALAFYNCGGGPRDQISALAPIRDELEAKFLEQERDRLTEFQLDGN